MSGTLTFEEFVRLLNMSRSEFRCCVHPPVCVSAPAVALPVPTLLFLSYAFPALAPATLATRRPHGGPYDDRDAPFVLQAAPLRKQTPR